MSAIAEIWMGKLSKLKGRVLAHRPVLSKAIEGSEAERAVEKEGSRKEENRGGVLQRNSSMMSESTVCLLMDRFVPW